MKKVREITDLASLKKWGSLDTNSYKLLQKYLGSEKKVLILGTKDSGKNTFQHAIVNYVHRLQKDTLVIPPVEGISLKSFKSNKKVTDLKKIFKGQKSYVAAVQHTGNAYADIDTMIEYFGKDFDIILDLRNFEGSRELNSIWYGKRGVRNVYTRYEDEFLYDETA